MAGRGNGAIAIADDGTIVGLGVLNDDLTAFAMMLTRTASTMRRTTARLSPSRRKETPTAMYMEIFYDADFNNDGIINALDLEQCRLVFFTPDADIDWASFRWDQSSVLL